MNKLVLYSSLTGNTKTFVHYLKLKSFEEFDVSNDFQVDINDYDLIALGSYTWGDGKIPKRMKKFLIENKDKWQGKNVLLFGSGNSIYTHFCGAIQGMRKILEDCGANIVEEFVYEQRFSLSNLDDEDEKKLNNFIKIWNG